MKMPYNVHIQIFVCAHINANQGNTFSMVT
uniref:Uncharacterized protein n=1 Tax=Anguilla anguilla TaxID=7936 RepID=A0A0E9RNF2_ANGAN